MWAGRCPSAPAGSVEASCLAAIANRSLLSVHMRRELRLRGAVRQCDKGVTTNCRHAFVLQATLECPKAPGLHSRRMLRDHAHNVVDDLKKPAIDIEPLACSAEP